ncbi:holin family protein [Paenibacillus sp. GCM10012307]|uniref:Phage holin family protein n=1 Tax=Paenibacillus roseus TaxID=2798579 RepID=A0A934J3E3_9BACL|nr:phage holin family protein [Paenibacillus roseus]MBJ6360889.1 phage holin family protein [Paenibacillus roseus]
MISKIGQTVLTAAVGSSGKETAIGGAVAAIGTFLAVSLGGWDTALKILAYCMAFDYLTGVLGAIKTKKLNSDVMFWGGIRKGVVLAVVGLAVLLDQLIGNDSPVFRTIALYFYIGREGLSIIENLGVLNVLVPQVMKDRLHQLNGKGGGKGADV